MNLRIDGLDDLTSDLTSAMRKYPDMAEARLKKIGNNFRKDVVASEKKSIKDDNRRSKNKLTTTKGFQVGKVHGYNENIEVDFSAKSSIFHLVEKGHEKVTRSGEKIGWVNGNFVVKKMREQYYNSVMLLEVKKLIEDITKACGL